MRAFGALALLLAVCASEPPAPSELEWAFLNACADGDYALVEKMVDAGFDVDSATPDGESALHLAGIGGSAAVVELLAARGARLDRRATSPRGLAMTPLAWLVYGLHVDATAALVSAGAAVNVVVRKETGALITALDIALGITGGPAEADAESISKILRNAGAKTYDDLTPFEKTHFAPPPRPSGEL
ncbi:hypothetical protein M885DRAFT_548893 [Pelagophyceae sp. CCMP2097]|nr:hypothetical protein M885DRAFT_548893 [Pelagophyceae sp. CCMP2097]